MRSNDIIANNIRKQIALNSGQLKITGSNGSYGFTDATSGTLLSPSSNASNFVLSNLPTKYQSQIRAEAYNYAKGVFGGKDVPDALVESLANLATYYSSQTGQSVQNLFKDGKLAPAFLANINTFLNPTIQFGYQSLNINQPWVNNPTLQGGISSALQPSLK
jgi:hypothetical protein